MEMERNKHVSLFTSILVAALLSQNLLIPVISTSVEDQKNYYSPDPHVGRPPSGSHRTPSHGTPKHGGTTPSHGSYNPTPSHGSYNPTPSTGGGGGGYGTPSTPSTPSGGSGGGGGYYHSPPTSGGGGGSPPLVLSPPPPLIPIDPGTPGISIPTPPFPPFLPDPNSPGTCNYWSTHPGVIWGLLGWWGTLGGSFGLSSFPGLGPNFSLQQALSNTRTDGLGQLYREGTASLLNSMVNKRFPFTTKQVRDRFAAALSSNKAAAAQAHIFKLANEGKLKPRD